MMLLLFRVKNFKSFRSMTEFSMLANNYSRALPENWEHVGQEQKRKLRVLKVAAIFGANAAGKSNLLQALTTVKRFVTSGLASNPTQVTGTVPFKLDDASTKPSYFELIFQIEDEIMRYVLELSETQVEREALFIRQNGVEKLAFERLAHASGTHTYTYQTTRLSQDASLEHKTRPNVAYITVGAQFNSPLLTSVFRWFEDILRPISIQELSNIALTNRTGELFADNEGYRQKIKDLVRAADLGIAEIEVEEKDLRLEDVKFEPNVPRELLDLVKAELMKHRHFDVTFKHFAGNAQVTMGLDEQSKGTIQMYLLAGPLLKSFEGGHVIIVDELDSSLHPLLIRFLIREFQARSKGKQIAQIIFTTHDATLLDSGLLRRDQIWFVEKDRHGASRTYALSDFHKLENESAYKGYLGGRYGAIPYI